MSLQPEQVISSSAAGKEKDATDWVWRVCVLWSVTTCHGL